MQVVYHIGAHATDEDLLARCLRRNTATNARHGLIVPWPARFGTVLRDALSGLRGKAGAPELQETLLDTITDTDEVHRVVLSQETFLCIAARVITPEGFYAMVPAKIAPMAALWEGKEVEFHIGLTNPATLIPALLTRVKDATYQSLMHGHDPRALRWAPLIRAIAAQARAGQEGGARLVVWCHEDTPLIWPEVLRAVSGLEEEPVLDGDLAIAHAVMLPEGFERMRAYLSSHPPASVAQRRKITAAFLDKFADPAKMEVEAALPGWDDALIDEITALYDADVAEIAAIEGVEFIAP